MFVDHIKKTVEVYVDDMLMKSRKENQHVVELTEEFDIFKAYKMKINLAKCALRSTSGGLWDSGDPKKDRGQFQKKYKHSSIWNHHKQRRRSRVLAFV